MKLPILMLLLAFGFQQYAQTNVELVANFNPYPSIGYNDIWGYVDQQGNEYALLFTQHGTSIVNLANPSAPVEAKFIPGPPSLWRDGKVHGNYAYVITEGTGTGRGLQIIDLSQLPGNATLVATNETWFTRAHNIFIDDGYAFVIGTNGVGGMHILDLSNPINPVRTAYYEGSGYIHDVYVWNDTVVACAEDSYDLIDITNKSNPVLISVSQSLPGIYAHSGWMTEDKRYFIGCEEFDQRDVTVWDLQDRTSWDLVVPQWQMTNPTPGNGDPVHNLFIKGNYAHISYYKHGYVVLDISDPTQPIMAGNYDTFASNSGTYNGAWGCYPFLPSGKILISDMETGLYVLNFNGIVPVELSSFTGIAMGNSVVLNWETKTETNNHGFEVQRKSGDEFFTIGFVNGAGTTTESHNYTFTNENMIDGNYQYRLKQLDFDGSFSFSDAINVELFSATKFRIQQNYPNPFNSSTKIKYAIPETGFVNISVFNSLGEKVKELVNEIKNSGVFEITFNAKDLSSGLYFARIQSGSYSDIIKMNLIK